jgi:hypothetical protein
MLPAMHTIRPEHVMASGALPPGFPAVEIEGEHYWDGGLSPTPLCNGWSTASRGATRWPSRLICAACHPLIPLLRLDAELRDQHGAALQLDVEQHLMMYVRSGPFSTKAADVACPRASAAPRKQT